jgi:hypothetical protein
MLLNSKEKNGNQTATYQETNYYRLLSKNFSAIKMEEMGLTDSGEQTHIFNPEKNLILVKFQKQNYYFLINSSIHPRELDGIDATMQIFH